MFHVPINRGVYRVFLQSVSLQMLICSHSGRPIGSGKSRLLCNCIVYKVFGKIAEDDDDVIPTCSKYKPALTYIRRGGGKILLHFGHQYAMKEKYKNGAEVWECIHRKRAKCGGKLTLQGTNILRDKQHTCTPDFAKNIIDERLNESKNALSSPECLSSIE